MTDRELMQQALEALKQYTDVVTSVNDPNSWVTVADGGKPAREAITALRERLAQPEQEPVACVQDLGEVKRKHLVYEKGMDWKDPLYTTPPQRQWQGLTEEEINRLWDGHVVPVFGKNGINPIVFARAIEAKLRERNA